TFFKIYFRLLRNHLQKTGPPNPLDKIFLLSCPASPTVPFRPGSRTADPGRWASIVSPSSPCNQEDPPPPPDRPPSAHAARSSRVKIHPAGRGTFPCRARR